MSARDELALELFIADNHAQPREQSVVDWEWFNATERYRGRIEHYKDMAAGALDAGYRKLEPMWAETLTNDDTYEYTFSSDCDGSNVQHWRRTPQTVCIEDASPWKAYEPEVRS